MCWLFARDPEEPSLQFLGTEYGLYVTIDGGETWTKWTNGFPTVSTMDLVIHPREQDLVIGTFGRSAYILDDIRPLRALARTMKRLLLQEYIPVETPVAYLADTGMPLDTILPEMPILKVRTVPTEARINYFVNMKEEDEGRKDSVVIEILDENREHIRTLKSVPENGLNRSQLGT